MHCASCASIVAKALRGRAGVSAAEVNYSSGSAKVSFDEAMVQPKDLEQLIEPLGYSLVVNNTHAHGHEHGNMDNQAAIVEELAALRTKVLASAPAAAIA